VNFTADVSLLPAGIREDIARELAEILERDPVQVAEQIRAWMAEETA
jgi:flagellar biosynthesis/type III secretory pathway M-ring protein FliF/YscJ